MEFDFLNVGGKESGGLAKKENSGGRYDSGSTVLWPLLDNASPLQQSIPSKTLQEQKPKNVLFNPISATAFQHISTVESFDANQKAHILQASQKSFDMNTVQQFAIHAYQNQDMNAYSAFTHHVNDARFSTVIHPSNPIPMNSPFSKVNDSSSSHNLNHQPSGSGVLKNTSLLGSEVEAIFPRKMLKPATTSAQLTIFYAGSVNVYDDVPYDKAQNVLLMASEGCKAAEKAIDSRAEAQALPFTEEPVSEDLGVAQTPKMASSHVVLSSHSSALSCASHIGNQSYVPTDDKVGVKTTGIPSQNDPSKTMNTSMGAVTAAIILPIAVPQARKASLARFLEKRKERASNSMPYSCGKKTLDNSTSDSSAQISLSNNQDCSWFFRPSKELQ